MIRFILLLLALLPLYLFGQNTEGEITYLETVKMKMDFGDGPEAEEMKKMIPQTQSFQKTLFFNANESLYQDRKGSEDEGEVEINHSDGNGAEFQIKVQRPENKFYRNLNEGISLEFREFFGREFLIHDKIKMPSWKITGEQKQILGFLCQKATLQVDSLTSLAAWFTPQIPVSTGPGIQAGLPGLILETAVNGDARTTVATKVDLKTLEEGSIEKPEKGKEVTAEEFKKIEAEKMKEMNMEMGGGGTGTIKMIIRN